jgi:6-phosphogluconolactonase
MELNIYETVDEATGKLADHFMHTVNAAIANTNECNVVLSGGSSPRRLYELLTLEPYRFSIDWSRISFFFGDERCVPFNDPANNGLMAKKALFEPLKIADSRIFYIPTSLKPEEAAKKYSKRIMAYFKDKPICFDLVLLGLGDDGHTASLFPHTPVLHEQKALVAAVFHEKEQSYRITMTAALINEAHAIAFYAYGENKAHAVKQILEGERNADAHPAQLISPENGTLSWFLDEDAGRLLQKVK